MDSKSANFILPPLAIGVNSPRIELAPKEANSFFQEEVPFSKTSRDASEDSHNSFPLCDK